MRGKTAGLENAAVLKIFARLSGGASAIESNVILDALNQDVYPELCDGIRLFSFPYLNDACDTITEDGFLQLHVDMHAAKPSFFDDGLLLSLWR